MNTAEKLQKFEEIHGNTEAWNTLRLYHSITEMTAASMHPSERECVVYLEVINILAVTAIDDAMSMLDQLDALDADSILQVLAECLTYTEYMALMYQVGFEQAQRANAPQQIIDTMERWNSELELRLESLRASTLEAVYEAS